MNTIKKRIISRFDIKGPNLVKGVNLEGLRIIGKPEFFSKIYYIEGIDEIIFQDTVASLYGRNNLIELIKKTSKEIFVPLVVGGGLRNVRDVREVLHAGADKISINSEAIKNILIIKKLVKEFGSSTISSQIQVQKKFNGKYYCYYENGREQTKLDPIEWAVKLQESGVGEILLTFINFDGTGRGFDEILISRLKNKLEIPLIVSGGIGNMSQVQNALTQNVEGVSISSMFHYYYLKQNLNEIKNSFFSEGNTEFFTNDKSIFFENTFSIKELKKFLIMNNINCR